MTDTCYFSTSWRQLTRNKGWIKPLLVLAIAPLVPVVGFLGVCGYGFEWALLSAWGVDASPKQSHVKVGACIVTGWRVFVVTFVWFVCAGFVWSLVVWLIGALAGNALLGLLALMTPVGIFLSILVVEVAALRAVIYGKISAGLHPVRVFQMIRRDPSGLFKLVAIDLVACTIGVAVSMALYFVCMLTLAGKFIEFAYLVNFEPTPASIQAVLTSVLAAILPACVLFGYLMSVVSATAATLRHNCVGLWMSQFDVASWGGPSDPLPAQVQPHAPANPVPPAPFVAEQVEVPGPLVVPDETREPEGPSDLEPAAEQSAPTPVPNDPEDNSMKDNSMTEQLPDDSSEEPTAQ